MIDPVGAGFVASFARPGGNITGFAGFEFGLSAKWLELLKQVAPRVTRGSSSRFAHTGRYRPVGRDPRRWRPSFGVEFSPLVVRDVGEIEPALRRSRVAERRLDRHDRHIDSRSPRSRSARWRPATDCQRFIPSASSSAAAA